MRGRAKESSSLAMMERATRTAIHRRHVIAMLGGAAAAWPLAVRAQQPTPVIGWMSGRAPQDSAHLLAAFREGLRELLKPLADAAEKASHDRLVVLSRELEKVANKIAGASATDGKLLKQKQAALESEVEKTVAGLYGLTAQEVFSIVG